jgi:hypothetical protein
VLWHELTGKHRDKKMRTENNIVMFKRFKTREIKGLRKRPGPNCMLVSP